MQREEAANTLRSWALDENLKQTVMANPALAALAGRVAARYTAGQTIQDAIAAAQAGLTRGHAASIEYAGESIRDAALARDETDVFLDLASSIAAADLPSTVSFDLSHIGAIIDRDLALRHAREMAAATAPLTTALMISAEGSDRTDLVLDLYDALAADYPHVGITLQARLHRTPDDLERAMKHPGRIRLVKGAFLEPTDLAYPRGSDVAYSAGNTLSDMAIYDRVEVLKGAVHALQGIDLAIQHGEVFGIIGRSGAGKSSLILAQEHVDQTYYVENTLFQHQPDYLLKVRGMSMRDAGIMDGDLLAVQSTKEARNGQIIVARLGDEVTVKRLKRNKLVIELHAENPDYPTIVVQPGEPFEIEGLAVGLIRNTMLM